MTGFTFKSSWRLIPVLGLAACVADGGPNTGRGRLSLSVSAQRPTTSTTASSVLQAGDSTVIALGSDSVIIRSADLVLRKLELKRVEAAQCEDQETETPDAAGEVDDENCVEVGAGPVLVTLPLGTAAVEAMVEVSAPAGQYDRLEFKIHVPKLPADTPFLRLNPDFQGVSVRVKGTFSHAGTRSEFTYLSDLEAGEESPINPPTTVAAGGTASITLRFDVSGWFLGADGTSLVDPATANTGGANVDVVRENIQRSINAFEDEDHDGHDDEGQDDNGHRGTGGGQGDG